MAYTVSTYRRRPKCLAYEEKENEIELHAVETTMQNRIAKSSRARKVRPSWIDRSLSSRSLLQTNTNTLDAYNFSSSRQAKDKAKQALTSPNVYRKKRVEAPANFVHEQKSYFEQVDAFELEEESPPSKDRWIPDLQQKDALAPCMQFHRKGLLQAVQEDAPDYLLNDISTCVRSSHKDPLSHILETPQSLQSLQTLESTKSFHCSEQGFVANASVMTRFSREAHATPVTKELTLEVQSKGQPLLDVHAQRTLDDTVQESLDRRPVMVEQPACCKALVTPTEPTPIIILSDDETEEFEALSRSVTLSKSKRFSRQAEEHGAVRARQKGPPVMIINDSPVPLNRDGDAHLYVAPVKGENNKGLSTLNKVSGNRDESAIPVEGVATELLAELKTSVLIDDFQYESKERLVEEVEKLHLEAFKSKSYTGLSKPNELITSKEQPDTLESTILSKAELLPTFEALLQKCGQSAPLQLKEAIMQFSDMRDVLKLGEGTYGEAFRASNLVFKIVPMGGNFLVNGEAQKTSAEMYTEMLLTLTLNKFRKQTSSDLSLRRNMCNNFIETKMVKVCQGLYDQALINAWEEWNTKHESENDHPKVFPKNQLYMLFVLADGGKDLESFSITSFDVARSILTQVTAALAIAEEDCEFEHRDLHWGNILVAQTKLTELCCTLDGTDMQIKTCGVFVNIIDFTLSRLSTGNEVLFSNLSDDPLLFEGPKGNIQADTYRKMLHLTEGHWNERFLKTNCYWIHYLVDILLTKKKVPCSHQESRALRAFKKQVLSYDSARECLQDEFFASVKQNRL
eukprot:c10082_g1_i1 orf=269-2662(-)